MLLIRPFSIKEALNIIQTAYVDVENHNVDAVVVVDADRDQLVHFFNHPLPIQKPVTSSPLFKKRSLCSLNYHSHYILMLLTPYGMLLLLQILIETYWNILGQLLLIQKPVTYSLLIRPFSREEAIAVYVDKNNVEVVVVVVIDESELLV